MQPVEPSLGSGLAAGRLRHSRSTLSGWLGRGIAAVALVVAVGWTDAGRAFDFEGFRSGMSLAEIQRSIGQQPTQTLRGPEGSTVIVSRPYSFELCADRLIGISRVIDRAAWLSDYRDFTGRLGDSAIEAVAGDAIRTVYFAWRDGTDKIVLGLNIDVRSKAADLGYAINVRDARPCAAAP